MDFPSEALLRFLNRSDRIVHNLTRKSKEFEKLEQYNEIQDALRMDIFQRYENYDVYFYGSRIIGIGTYRSDLDIYVDSDQKFMCGVPADIAQAQLLAIADVMRLNGNWRIELSLADATVPVLRCIYIPKQLTCDITFSDGLAVMNSDLLKHLFEIQPEAIKLFHCIRIWLSTMKVNLKRYQLTLLVVFFLQCRGSMPSIARVQRGLERKCIKGAVISLNDKRTLKDYGCSEMKSYDHYVSRFFQFYSEFDFDNLVVFPYLGKAVRKIDYESKSPFLTRICKDLTGFKWSKPMAVASTLTINYNVTYNFGQKRLQRFIDVCNRSFDLLGNNPDC